MKLYCHLSGLPLAELSKFKFRHLPGKLPFIQDWKESQLIHPVFSLSRFELTRQYHLKKFYSHEEESERNWNHGDKSLWFLAALNSTGLLLVSAPQLPPYKIANRYFHRVILVLQFLDSVLSPRITSRFPKLHISKEYNWSGFVGWLEAVEEAITNWDKTVEARKRDAKRDALKQQAELKIAYATIGTLSKESMLFYLWKIVENELPSDIANKKILQNGFQSKQRTIYPLGSWTPLKNRNRFCYYVTQREWLKDIFCSTRAAIQREDIDRQDVQVLEDLVITYVEHGTIASKQIFQRIQELYLWIQESRAFFDSVEVLGVGANSANAIEMKQKQDASILASPAANLVEAPKKEDYATEAAWLVASITWNKAQKLRSASEGDKNAA